MNPYHIGMYSYLAEIIVSHSVYTPVYTMYTMLVSGIISSTGLATVQNQILNMLIIPYYNLQTET